MVTDCPRTFKQLIAATIRKFRQDIIYEHSENIAQDDRLLKLEESVRRQEEMLKEILDEVKA